ncbi:MAG: hypothetical protein EA437_06680 [Candidatus Nitrosomarinus sp.]|nr:MAG: hypothetical protein EA437_06680 [Candidatus Nitrosomarinus sp.]
MNNFEKKLPDESCRHCGGKLIEAKKCSHCFKNVVMICKCCHTMTTEQFHSLCMSKPIDHTVSVPKIMPSIYLPLVASA